MESAGGVLWDVVEEHLGDAGFRWGQWLRALASPALTAGDVAAGIEDPLRASIDALTIAAPEAGAQILEPALRQPALQRALELAVRSRRTRTVDCRAFARDQLQRQSAPAMGSGAARRLDHLLQS